jgi:translation initiation factor 2 subunit 2
MADTVSGSGALSHKNVAREETDMDKKLQEERKPRKSVAFSEGTTIVDSNGQVTEAAEQHGEKSSAETHSAGTNKQQQQQQAIVEQREDPSSPNATCTAAPPAGEEGGVDEMTAMFEGLAKKKKKSSSKKEKAATAAADDEDAPAADAEFDPSALKKKKKKAKKIEADDFEAKLAEAGAAEEANNAENNDDGPAAEGSSSQEGDLEKGTGIWQHSNTTAIEYPLLLTRFFSQLNHHNPDLASSGGKSYKIPPPQCLREGNKKTIFANISEICRRMKRTDEHVTQFLFSELGTSGSVAGQGQLVIKGRFQQKQLENVLRRYIGMFLIAVFLYHLFVPANTFL